MKLEYYPKITKTILEKNINTINTNKDHWQEPFFTDTESYLNINKIKELSSKYLTPEIQNIIILGTGGSIQTFQAMAHLSKKTIYSINSSRAVELNNCLKHTSAKNSLVIPISRSGKTLDVNSTIGTFLERNYPFLGLSSRGPMNDLLREIGAPILEVPDLSGRFAASITNVAMVPAYICQIDISSFLNGLKEGYNEFLTFKENPSLEFASFIFNLYKKGYSLIFSMPYSKNLEGSVGLFVQEISESSGKEGKGLMGAYQEAPLCQHSVLEYLLGGPKGYVLPIIWTIEKEEPNLLLNSSLKYVDGHLAQEIVNYQADATFQALIEENVPSAKFSIGTPNEQDIGILVAFIQSCIYYLCLLLDVNWANNPMVNIGKEICNEALKNELDPSNRRDIRKKLAKEKFENFFD
jgi:glucose-6-phosphate isomerase